MPDIVQAVATHTGIDQATIEKALASILAMLKSHLPAETFSQIEEKIPESAQLVDTTPESSGGILNVASKLAGKVFGSKVQDGLEMAEHFNKLGISAASLTSIVASLYKSLSAHLPPEVMAQIVKALPSIPGVNLTTEGLPDQPAAE